MGSEMCIRDRDFDKLNIRTLEGLLEPIELRPDVTKAEAIEIFRRFQDSFHANYPIVEFSSQEFQNHEESCRKIVDILLYGIVDRKKE